MEREELEQYEYQLAQVNLSLQEDPSNAELIALQEELSTLVQMTKEYLGLQPGSSSSGGAKKGSNSGSGSGSSSSSSNAAKGTAAKGGPSSSTPTSSSSKPTTAASSSSSSVKPPTATPSSSSTATNPPAPIVPFPAGAEVLAKWHVDNKFYPARIASVSGSSSDPVYSVIFHIDKSTEVLRHNDLRPGKESKKRGHEGVGGPNEARTGATSGSRGESPALAATSTTTASTTTEGDAGTSSEPGGAASKKLKKSEKKAVKEDERKARVAEQNAKQSSWQSFAKKSVKKGIKIAGLTGESQFRSPDNPYGRVGVVGSGKGVTQYAEKKRAVFTPAGESNP